MFTSYQTGADFLRDNAPLLRSHPLETVFFPVNARQMPNMDQGFAVKVQEGQRALLAIRNGPFPMVLYGESALCPQLAQALGRGGYTFGRVLGSEEVTTAFLSAYEALCGGSHSLVHAMDIMRCDALRDCPTPDVETAAGADAAELAQLTLRFDRDTSQPPRSLEEIREEVAGALDGYVLIRRDGAIAAMARRARQEADLCAVTGVYTHPDHRGRGLARQVVTHLTRAIRAEGRLPYLFVDQANPITNHLYPSIGYTYDAPTLEWAYHPAQ